MKICLLTKNPHLNSNQFLADFLQNHELRVVTDYQLVQRDELLINRIHGMDYDDRDLDYLEKMNLKSLNNLAMTRTFRDKYQQYLFLNRNNFFTLRTSRNPSEFNYPFIAKTLRGMKGLGVYKIETLTELTELTVNDKRYLYQEFVSNLEEYRYLYFLGFSALLKKSNICSFKKNLAEGTEYEITGIPSDVSSQLSRFHSKVKLNFYALDLFINANKLLIFDINTNPGVEILKNILIPSDLINCQKNLSFL